MAEDRAAASRRPSRPVVRARLLLGLASLLAVAGCGGGGGSSSSPNSSASVAPMPTPVPGSAPIFDQSVLHDARLDLDPSAWQTLRDNYMSNDYYVANLSIDGVAVSRVGIRSRGTGSRSQEKPGLKVDFNNYVKGQEYYGYKTVVLKNLVQDASMLRERLSFAVFEAMGIVAPRNSFARLTVNGEYWGVYAITEAVTKPLLKSRFGEDGGNLFEYQWTFEYDLALLGSDPQKYVPVPFEPKTNEDRSDVGDGLLAFIEAVNNTPAAGYSATLGQRIDVDRFLAHVAVENALAEGDGLVGDQGINNFYLYEYAQKNRFVFIPWDKDNTFRSGTWPLHRNLDANVLTSRLTADPAKRQVYVDAVAKAVGSFVNPRWLTPQLETAYQQIRAAALADAHKPFSNGEFEAAINGLRGVIAAREHDVNAQR